MIGRTISHYRITDRIGGGGMGVVYRAEDLKLGRTVALKFLPPELGLDPAAKHRFEREARAASLLDHPNICTIFDFGEADGDGQMYLAMPCYDGQSLAEKIERGPVSLDEAIRIIEQVARGLGKAHAAGIVHRDIKPANIMLTSDGIAKILDFGLAKLMLGSNITRSNTTLGTAAYMSPEQIRGEDVGPQSDIWSLGIVLFELLTGTRPFRGEYPEALTYSILNEQPASLPDQPDADRVIKRMLRKDPLQRYQTVDEVIADLQWLKSPTSSTERKRQRLASSSQRLRTGAKLGPYQIVKPLGSGGMGDVYLARDTRLDRQVAIKVLPAEFSEDAERKERFKREAKVISQLHAPNICTLFDVGEQEGVDYLVMEFLEGETLAEKKLPLPISQVLRIGAQMARGLAAAHRQGIVHRDLKPANVMITKSGAVKLLDFGLAKNIGILGSSKPDELTGEGKIVGTLAYMSPEQIEGHDTDARSDIFALGAILYELVAGRRPFEGKTKATLIAAIVTTEPPPIRNIPTPALEHVIRKCLVKERDDRWQSATDVAGELEWIKDAPTTELAIKRPMRMRTRILAAVAALAVVAALIGVALSFQRRLDLANRPLRTELALPPSTLLRGVVTGPIALSPDGSRIAMAVVKSQDPKSTTAAESAIVVRDLASGDFKVLAGTDDAVFPFWAPDGKRIGFFANAKLKIINLDGGVVRALCDARDPTGGSWNRDGVILFAPDTTGSIYKVSESGGTPADVTKAPANWSHENPTFLPDGRTFLFTGHDSAMATGNLYAGSLDGGPTKLVTENASNAAVVGDRLVFVRNRTLVSQKFDPKTVTVSGTPTDIVQDVYTFALRDLAMFSAAGNSLIYVPRPVAPVQIGVFDATGRQLDQKGTPANYHILDVSADGKTAAVWIGDDVWAADVWLVQLDSGVRSRLTFANSNQPSAVFSPDGSRLVTCGTEGLRGHSKILIHPISGGPAEEVAELPRWMAITGWSPDGKYLVGSGRFGQPLLLVDIAAHKIIPMQSPPAGYMPAVSPDGKWLSYTSEESGIAQIYLTEFPQGRGKWQVSVDTGYDPRWSPDGKKLFFKTARRLWVAEASQGGVPRFGTPVSLPIDSDALYLTVGYGVLNDGKIVALSHADDIPDQTVHLITNWTKLLPQ
jgi:serine/threonine protein kinase/Tol biopolymer transport system component